MWNIEYAGCHTAHEHCKMMHVRQLTGDMVSGNEVTQTVKLLLLVIIIKNQSLNLEEYLMWSSPTIYYLQYLGDDNMTDNTLNGKCKVCSVLSILSPSAYILLIPSKTGHTMYGAVVTLMVQNNSICTVRRWAWSLTSPWWRPAAG